MNKVIVMAQRHSLALLCLNGVLLSTAIAMAELAPKTWTASSQLILPDSTSNLEANLGTLGNLKDSSIQFSNTVNPLNTQAGIITSKDVLLAAWKSDPEKSQFQRLDNYKKLFKVTPVDQSTTLKLEVKADAPDVALHRAASLVNAYQLRLNELRRDEAVARVKFSRSELEAAAQNLLAAQIPLAAFKKSSGLINAEQQTTGIVATITTLSAARATALAQAAANTSLVTTLSQRLGLTPEQALVSLRLGEDKDYQAARQLSQQVASALVQTQARFQDSSPSVQSLQELRQQVQAQLSQHLAQSGANPGVDTTVDSTSSDGRAALIQRLILAESEASMQSRQAAQLQTQLAQLSTTLRALPAHQARIQQLQRQYDIAEGVYQGLIAQVQKAKVSAFNSYPNVQLLEAPNVDPKPTSPKPLFIGLGAIVAAIFGSLALVLFLESRHPLFQLQDLQQLDYPLLVSIPRLKQLHLELNASAQTQLEFQRLASLVSLMPLTNRRLMVSSAAVGEGKTTVTFGLALALLDLGFRVLVVDGDVHNPTLCRRLCVPPPASPHPVAIRPGLDLMPLLPDDGKVIEFIAKGGFAQALDAITASNDYDYVLVDSGPVGLTSETALMTVAVPNVLFVARPGVSGRHLVYESVKQLTRHHGRILGLVVNGLNSASASYTYPYQSQPQLLES